MLSLYSGTPGSGKSLHVASRIAVRLRAGKPVIANFGFDAAACGRRGREVPFTYKPNDEITPAWLVSFAAEWWAAHRFHEDGILLVLDEAQLLFNAREWAKQGRADWLSFFTQHRKYGYEIVLVAQFDRMIDRQIRSLIEYEYIHRKVSNFGFWGKLFAIWTLNKLFVAVKMWYPLGEKVGTDWFVARPRVYRLYNTYNTFSSSEGRAGPDVAAASVPEKPRKRFPAFLKQKENNTLGRQTEEAPRADVPTTATFREVG